MLIILNARTWMLMCKVDVSISAFWSRMPRDTVFFFSFVALLLITQFARRGLLTRLSGPLLPQCITLAKHWQSMCSMCSGANVVSRRARGTSSRAPRGFCVCSVWRTRWKACLAPYARTSSITVNELSSLSERFFLHRFARTFPYYKLVYVL